MLTDEITAYFPQEIALYAFLPPSLKQNSLCLTPMPHILWQRTHTHTHRDTKDANRNALRDGSLHWMSWTLECDAL